MAEESAPGPLSGEALWRLLGDLDARPPIVVSAVSDMPPLNRGADTLLLGPASEGELRPYLAGKALRVNATSKTPYQGGGLTQEEAIWIPRTQGAFHRGGVLGLNDVVRALLNPEGGCPWDLEQTHETLAKYLIEESYELIEAIQACDAAGMREEIGDVLLQPLMHARMAEKRGEFGIEEVADAAANKLVRRHPHVFGDTAVADADEVLKNWDRIKSSEGEGKPKGILDGVPKSLPALLRAHTISKRAARAGFEWPDLEGVFAKLHEEIAELKAELEHGDPERMKSEIGDLLFTVVNIARWLKVDAEQALRDMLDRFTTRFQRMEREAKRPLSELTPMEWDDAWNRAKMVESQDNV